MSQLFTTNGLVASREHTNLSLYIELNNLHKQKIITSFAIEGEEMNVESVRSSLTNTWD